MANILEISQAQWQQVSQPSNILVIPSQQPLNPNPHIPARPNWTIKEYVQGGPCPDGASAILLVHDGNSGWWFELQDIRLTLPLTGYDGTVFNSVHDFFAREMLTLINQITGASIDLDDPLSLFTWAQPDHWSGLYNWDFWTISCDTDYILLQTKLKPTGPTGATGTTGATGATGPPPPGATGPMPDQDGDEITYDLCLQLQGYTNQIIAALGGIAQDPTCCQLVVATLQDLDLTLGAIANNLSVIATGSSKGIDWTPVTRGLADIASRLGGGAVDFTPLIAAINGGAVPVNPTPPKPVGVPQGTPTTVAEALAAVQDAISQMPFVVQS